MLSREQGCVRRREERQATGRVLGRWRSGSAYGALALTLVSACAPRLARNDASRAPAAMVGGSEAPLVRGVIGDTVRMVVNHVRPDRREQFERFMREVLHPTMDRAAASDPVTADHMRRARMLQAVKPDSDGTYTYIFLVDPAGSSAPYSFARLIQRMYPPEQAAENLKLYRESLARPSESSTLVNAVW